MNYYRILIIVGQLGAIWAKQHTHRQVYRSLAAIGYFTMMSELYDDTGEQTFIMGKHVKNNEIKYMITKKNV